MVSRRLIAVMAVTVLAPLGLAACGDDKQPVTSNGDAPPASSTPSEVAQQEQAPAGDVQISVTPATGKTDVPISAEIGVKVDGGTVKTVTLKDAKGGAVAGEMREDGSSFVPAKPLKNKVGYEATVVAADAAGAEKTATTKFTTMAKPGKKTGSGLYLFDDHTYGVAMPVVAEFTPGIKKADRAAVQKRLFVKTDPPQPGTWSWTSSGTQAYYRAPEHWKPGTKLTVRLGLAGLPMGGGRYGGQDRSATAKIGRDFQMKVDDKTKKMTVIQDGKTIKTMLVSLGKKSTPSSSGNLVVMEKKASTVFDTTDTDGAAGYRANIEYAQRLTWSGQYIHSAPWSAGAQGRRNVSHGCVNMSPANARWLFDKTLIGDPVTVQNTGDKLDYGNGWTPWDVSWKEFAKGSALPVPADLG
ncbi:Ig-like domain-containing protein [Actinoplanes sp. NPDC089786]|uniref:L,D-transpeptidase n=1 Tax=Actinoplanes sp. NPDC089786 TaxID=3155185 RepID=UPI003426F47D